MGDVSQEVQLKDAYSRAERERAWGVNNELRYVPRDGWWRLVNGHCVPRRGRLASFWRMLFDVAPRYGFELYTLRGLKGGMARAHVFLIGPGRDYSYLCNSCKARFHEVVLDKLTRGAK